MSYITGKVRIKPRQDPAATWTSNNPILAKGEHGYEVDVLNGILPREVVVP